MSEAADGAVRRAGGPAGAIRRLWGGEVPLARAFWDYAVIWGTALNIAVTLLAMAVLASGAPAVLATAVFMLPIPYNLLVLVGVWRSAAAYQGRRLWADLARAGVTVWALGACLL